MQVCDLLQPNPRPASAFYRNVNLREPSHARVWGSIFIPGLIPDDICNKMKEMSWNRYIQDLDLILIGSGLEYLYEGKKAPHPIHLVMLGMNNTSQECFHLSGDTTKLFRQHETFPGGIKIMDSNIVLHFDLITIPTLWKLGVQQTCVLSYKSSKELDKVDMSYSLDEVPSGGGSQLGYRCEVPVHFGTRPGKRFEITGGPPESIETFLREVSQQFLGIKGTVGAH